MSGLSFLSLGIFAVLLFIALNYTYRKREGWQIMASLIGVCAGLFTIFMAAVL